MKRFLVQYVAEREVNMRITARPAVGSEAERDPYREPEIAAHLFGVYAEATKETKGTEVTKATKETKGTEVTKATKETKGTQGTKGTSDKETAASLKSFSSLRSLSSLEGGSNG